MTQRVILAELVVRFFVALFGVDDVQMETVGFGHGQDGGGTGIGLHMPLEYCNPKQRGVLHYECIVCQRTL